MDLKEYIAKAKAVLNPIKEDAGSEGFCYLLKYSGSLKEEGFKVEEKTEEGTKIRFDYPHDYGFALQTLKDLGIEVEELRLLF
jgi:hypothetical protein